MSAAEKEPTPSAMFGDEEAGPDEPEEDGKESEDDLRALGEAALAAQATGDGLAFAKAIRDMLGDKE